MTNQNLKAIIEHILKKKRVFKNDDNIMPFKK